MAEALITKPKKISSSIPFVVGIGASAGGLEAINELFDAIKENQGFAFVIIQHLSPNHESLMDELLARHTHMKIKKASEGMRIQPNQVYLIPNKNLLTLKHSKFHLTSKSPNSPSETIDVFFESLARDQKERAVGIILSGTGTDGTKGLKQIKDNGGLTIVQEPSTAKFNGMPNSAIESGIADLVLDPQKIGSQIFDIARKNYDYNKDANAEIEADLVELQEIIGLVNQHTPHDFSSYKEHTLHRRVKRRLSQLEIDSFQEYIYYLKNNIEEIEHLGQEFLIGVTRFFRDTEAFNIIKSEVIPSIVKSKANHGNIKAWASACSTGEEAYSLAILFCEELSKQGKNATVKIFATDIDVNSIEFAARGMYGDQVKDQVSEEILKKYFLHEGGSYIVKPSIRRMVIFAQHNIIKDPPFSKADLVSCRNMLIYMKPSLQKKVLATLHFALNLEGYLFLGGSESGDDLSHAVREINKKWNIFQVTSKSKNFVFNRTNSSSDHLTKVHRNSRIPAFPKQSNTDNSFQTVFQEILLEEEGYAVFFIDEQLKLLQALGNHKDFLQIPDKVLETNLLKLLPQELAIGLNLAARRALRNNEKIVSKHLELVSGDEVRLVSLAVTPYLDGSQFSQKVLSVFLRDEGYRKIAVEEPNSYDRQQFQDNRQLELEEELRDLRQELRATVEELETSNEEMQSSNEELLSSNEELQSTNEELQSLNEELYTVNAEHQQKIVELQELNDDLNNYLRSTDIGQIFLDENTNVRKFTPAVRKQINLIESDLGRPFNHLTYNFKDTHLLENIAQVLAKGSVIEREVETQDGNYYLMKLLPYYRHDGTIAGTILTFVNVTRVKQLNNLLSGILSSSPNGIIAFSAVKYNDVLIDLKVDLINNAALSLLNKSKQANLTGQLFLQLFPQFNTDKLLKMLRQVEKTGKAHQAELQFKSDAADKWLEIVIVATETGLMLTIIDITANKEAEAELNKAYSEVKETSEKLKNLNSNLEDRVTNRTKLLAESEERFRLLSRSTNDAVWDWNLITGEFWWNEGFRKIFGYNQTEIEPGVNSLYKRLHPDEKEKIISQINDAINLSKSDWTGEHLFLKNDGNYAQVYNRSKLLKNEYDIPYRMLGSIIDITNLKETQDELKQANQHLRRTNKDLDNFVYTASHDLRAPVANLTGLMTLLTPPLNLTIEGKDKHLMNMVSKSVAKLKRTIDSLLEVTQSQNELERKLEWVYFDEIIANVKADLRDQYVASRGKINVSLEVDKICYTYSQMRSILYNLMSNAIKYRSPNRSLLLQIRTIDEGESVLLEFQDNGMGLEKRSQDRIFTMFRRFHSHIEGTGIGLYIIKRVIESNEGSITVDSENNVGTTFKVRFKKEVPSENQLT